MIKNLSFLLESSAYGTVFKKRCGYSLWDFLKGKDDLESGYLIT